MGVQWRQIVMNGTRDQGPWAQRLHAATGEPWIKEDQYHVTRRDNTPGEMARTR